MALMIKRFSQFIHDELHINSDPRTKDMFLMGSPFPILSIAGCYLLSIRLLNKFMEKRKPYDLKNVILVYNVFQIVSNTIIAFEGIRKTMTMSLHCSPIDFSTDPRSMYLLKIIYLYFVTRLFDALDTIFFVLRKKGSHVTFLHTYHHCGMILLSWIGVKRFGGGHSIYLGTINSFVHSFMYTYYFLSALDSKYKNSEALKKFITQLQLVQHGTLFLIYTYNFLVPGCEFPKYACYVIIPQTLFMCLLFGDFYYKAYINPEKKTKTLKED